jgi:hypothetical protein
MARITMGVLQFEARYFDETLASYNKGQAQLTKYYEDSILPHKCKKITLISKEKSSSWDEKSTTNLYSYTISYPDSQALVDFAQQLGATKAVAIAQGVYGKEAIND